MHCHACHRDNPPNFVVCACGQRRIVNPSDWNSSSPRTNGNAKHTSGTTSTTATIDPASPAAPVADSRAVPRFTRDATRYLCAAVQTDSTLNQRIILSTVDDQRRAIASSPGVDLVTVVKYALAARRRQTIRNSLLAGLAVILIASIFGTDFEPAALLGLLSGGLLFLILALAWIVVFVEILITYYGVLAPQLRRDTFDQAKSPVPQNPAMRNRLDELAAYDRGNVTVFSEYAPFMGYGVIYDTWSFGLNVATAEEGKTVHPFTVHDLYAHIAESVRALSLPSTTVENRLFVSGADLQNHLDSQAQDAILPDFTKAPATDVDEQLFRNLREDPDNRARAYLAVRVHGWGGELVMTIFLRFALLPGRDLLFVEANYALLTPVRPRYRAVDHVLERPSSGMAFHLAGNAFRSLPGALAGSIPLLLGQLSRSFRGFSRKDRETARTMQENAFNYGSTASPRELASDKRYSRYFQKLDSDMYAKIAERRIMDSMVEFLQQHNIDASELIKRQTVILNNGVYVTGEGSINANSIAAGHKSSARSTNRASQGGDHPSGTAA